MNNSHLLLPSKDLIWLGWLGKQEDKKTGFPFGSGTMWATDKASAGLELESEPS